MKKLASVLVIALALVALTNGSAFAHDTTVTLNEMSSSGQTGTAVLTGMEDGTTKVVITVTPASAEAQPVHIHNGTCGAGLGDHFYDLNDIVNGTSETIVPYDVHDLNKGNLAINVHKSHTEENVHVVCAVIMAQATTHEEEHEETSPGMPRTGSGDTLLPLLALGGAWLVIAGVALRRRARA